MRRWPPARSRRAVSGRSVQAKLSAAVARLMGSRAGSAKASSGKAVMSTPAPPPYCLATCGGDGDHDDHDENMDDEAEDEDDDEAEHEEEGECDLGELGSASASSASDAAGLRLLLGVLLDLDHE